MTLKKNNPVPGASRRDFLKQNALAAAAIASGPSLIRNSLYGAAPASASVIGANDRIRVGFIGVGGQGFNTHVRTVASNSSSWNIEGVAVCDVWSARVDRARNHLNLKES